MIVQIQRVERNVSLYIIGREKTMFLNRPKAERKLCLHIDEN